MSAPGLLQLQRQMQARVLRGEVALLGHVDGDSVADAARRSRVYEDAYRLRLIEVLGNDFPALQAYLGPEVFQQQATGYLAAHPSRYYSVRHVGTEFAAWLRQQPLDAQRIDSQRIGSHCAELAAFEWAQGEVFDAADSDIVVLDEIAALPPEAWSGLRLQMKPALRCLSLHGNAPAFVAAHGSDAPQPEVIWRAAATPWLLWRRGFDVYWRTLEPDESAALDAALMGADFGEICATLCTWHPHDAVALRAASLLKLWIGDELIAGVELDSATSTAG